MKNLPLKPTLLVTLVIGILIGLGIWQLKRLQEKQSLLAQYAEAANTPAIPYPAHPAKADVPQYAFHKSSGYCARVTDWAAVQGHNIHGESGWSHTATCFTGEADAEPLIVTIGWSRSGDTPSWQGGQVSGTIIPDPTHVIKLIADEPAAGLEQSQVPGPDSISNNHLGYALTWFTFAALAGIFYILALRRHGR